MLMPINTVKGNLHLEQSFIYYRVKKEVYTAFENWPI